MKPALVVMAAGMGSRYGGLKQLDPLGPGGETLLEYSLYDALRAGLGEAVFVLRPEMEEAFRDAVGRRLPERLRVRYAFQAPDRLPPGFAAPPGRDKPWGTGEAVLAAAAEVRGPFAVINADDFYGRRGFEAVAAHLERARDAQPAEWCLVGYPVGAALSAHGPVSRGLCRLDGGRNLLGITELGGVEKDDGGARYKDSQGRVRRLKGDEPVSMNLWGFTPSVFAHLRRLFLDFLREKGGDAGAEFPLPAAVQSAIDSGLARVTVLPGRDACFGVTHPRDRPLAAEAVRRLVAEGAYPERLWS